MKKLLCGLLLSLSNGLFAFDNIADTISNINDNHKKMNGMGILELIIDYVCTAKIADYSNYKEYKEEVSFVEEERRSNEKKELIHNYMHNYKIYDNRNEVVSIITKIEMERIQEFVYSFVQRINSQVVFKLYQPNFLLSAMHNRICAEIEREQESFFYDNVNVPENYKLLHSKALLKAFWFVLVVVFNLYHTKDIDATIEQLCIYASECYTTQNEQFNFFYPIQGIFSWFQKKDTLKLNAIKSEKINCFLQNFQPFSDQQYKETTDHIKQNTDKNTVNEPLKKFATQTVVIGTISYTLSTENRFSRWARKNPKKSAFLAAVAGATLMGIKVSIEKK